MPLPATNPTSLMGHSRPGEAIATKPKVAMMVRMTEDALDALQGLASEQQMEFEFGGRPVSTVSSSNCGRTFTNLLRKGDSCP